MITFFLKAFLLANILLGFSYFLFSSIQWLLRSFKIYVSPQQFVRWSQIVVLASILVPCILSSIPREDLPEFRLPTFRTAFEGDLRGADPKSPHATYSGSQKIYQTTIKIDPDRLATFLVWTRNSVSKDPLALFVFAYLAGLFVFVPLLIYRFSKLEKIITEVFAVRAFGRVRIGISSSLNIPISVFLRGKYWVIVPDALVSDRGDLRLALKHELQHHRQGDTRWAILIEWLVCLLYLNPAVYFWKWRIIELQEFSCDEALVGQQGISSHEYGSCLLRVAEAALGCREVYVGTTYMAAAAKSPEYFKSFLKRRVEMLLNREQPRSYKWVGLSLGTLGLIFTLSVAYGIERSARALNDAFPNSGAVVVDQKIQKISQKILSDAIANEEASEGFAIVADPQTGKILAVANVDTKDKKNGYWALAQLMEPASIAKTLVVAEAIEQGKTTPAEKHFCENGKYKFGGKEFHDWKHTGFDHLTTAQTVAKSSDICTVKIAERVGLEGIHSLLEKYGFGTGGTAKDFPAAKVGQLPPRDGPLGKFLIPYVAYGQGFRSTPLELVQAYGAIANGGSLLMPLSADAPDSAKKVIRRVLSPENAEKVKGILREVVLSGTGKQNAGSYLYSTAGKTASAFSPDEEWLETSRGTRKSNVAGFIGFAPVDNPRIEVYVTIRDPKVSREHDSGAHGAEHAAPVFKQITETVLQHMKVAPDNLQQL